MKIKLNLNLCYLIGFWYKKQCKEGVCFVGNEKEKEIFIKKILEENLIEPEKIQIDGKKAFFYHNGVRKFFNKILKEKMERFKHKNEYAANFFAGLFDAIGKVDEKGRVVLKKINKEDELMLARLGFLLKKEGKEFIVKKPLLFLMFIKNWVILKKDRLKIIEGNNERKI